MHTGERRIWNRRPEADRGKLTHTGGHGIQDRLGGQRPNEAPGGSHCSGFLGGRIDLRLGRVLLLCGGTKGGTGLGRGSA